MKNRLAIITIALLLNTSFFSCKKLGLLNESPQSNYYLTNINSSLLETLVIGAYEPLSRSRGRLWESTFGINIELQSDYAISTDLAFLPVSTYNFNIISNASDTWTTFYQAIGRANFIINGLNGNTQIPTVAINTAVGEASFIRALCYYNLVRTWGKVPLRLKPVIDGDNTGQPLATTDDIYKQIIIDLNTARQYLPVTVPATKAGRATKGSAMTMLADVYLTTQNYINARSLAKAVIDSSTILGYKLEPSLNVIYSPTIKSNTEDVFSIKFADITAYGNFLPAYVHDSRAKQANLAARGLQRINTIKNTPLITGWDTKDLRRAFNLYDTISISGVKLRANVPVGQYFFGKYIDPAAPAENGAGNSFYIYRYADVLLIFAEAENKLNGPTTDAYNAINQVRRRGYGLPVSTPNSISDIPGGLSQTDFDNIVFRERGYEFFFEDKRWFDLNRTGRTNAIIQAGGKSIPSTIYWPLPAIEIANNSALH